MPVDAASAAEWLPGWLPSQRWFADKTRPIDRCGVLASAPLSDDVLFTIVRVTFDDGADADYVVPLTGHPLADAVGHVAFLEWLGGLVSGSADLPSFVRRRELSHSGGDLAGLPARPLGVEQSNTSIRYGGERIVKLNRRLSYGPSPELELTGLLNRWDGPRCAPRTYSALTVGTDAGIASLAIQAEFVANRGDGWTFALDALRSEVADGTLGHPESRSLQELRTVAELTGDLHTALAADPWTSELAPERITGETAARWRTDAERSLEHVVQAISRMRASLSGRSLRLAELVDDASPTIREQLAGFTSLTGSLRTRIHGDYHLGQVLRTPEGGYVAIDFDGEPQRSLEERREKYSPLRDVAGMMRSIAYAAGTVQAESGDADPAAFPAWERAARSAFLDRYVARLAANGADVLPRDPERVRLALAALEVEKAIYEVGYELNNRPDWVWIPLTRLVRSG